MIDLKAMRPALEHLANRLDARLARVAGERQRADGRGLPWDAPAALAASVRLMRAEVRPLLVAMVGEGGADPVLEKVADRYELEAATALGDPRPIDLCGMVAAAMPARATHSRACHERHTGAWACEPGYLCAAVSAVRSGTRPMRATTQEMLDELDAMVMQRVGPVAVVHLSGPLMKPWSKYGGTSTVAVRQALREAAQDETIGAVLLVVESPGGTVAGTDELAQAVREFPKPLVARVDDLAASAAYWVASQAPVIHANRAAEIGSIGAYVVVYDESGAYEMAGIKPVVIASGDMKGADVAGVPVSDELVSEYRAAVDAYHAMFVDAVATGRKMDRDAVAALADGRMMMAAQAVDLGLIDEIATAEESMALAQTLAGKALAPRQPRGQRARAATARARAALVK